MTNFKKLKTLTKDELADWLDNYGQFDDSPWMNWFNTKYCSKCEPIKVSYESSKQKLGLEPLLPGLAAGCAYCELNDYCKFFSQIDGIPDNKEIIKMWLDEEADYDGRSNDSKSIN